MTVLVQLAGERGGEDACRHSSPNPDQSSGCSRTLHAMKSASAVIDSAGCYQEAKSTNGWSSARRLSSSLQTQTVAFASVLSRPRKNANLLSFPGKVPLRLAHFRPCPRE